MHHGRGGGLARDRSRAWGAVARILGVLGIAIGIALVALVLVGRGHAHARVGEIEATIDAGLAQGLVPLDAVRERARGIEALVDGVVEAVRERVADSGKAAQLRETLLARTTAFSERYLALRASYAEARERLVATLERLQTLERSLPVLSIPKGPLEALAALDLEVRGADARVLQLLAAASGEGVQAEGLAAQVGSLRDRFGRVAPGLDGVRARMNGLRSEVADAADDARRLLTALAVALVLAILYGVFLHGVLYRAGQGPPRGAHTAVAG